MDVEMEPSQPPSQPQQPPPQQGGPPAAAPVHNTSFGGGGGAFAALRDAVAAQLSGEMYESAEVLAALLVAATRAAADAHGSGGEALALWAHAEALSLLAAALRARREPRRAADAAERALQATQAAAAAGGEAEEAEEARLAAARLLLARCFADLDAPRQALKQLRAIPARAARLPALMLTARMHERAGCVRARTRGCACNALARLLA
jgi:hypothetical protein